MTSEQLLVAWLEEAFSTIERPDTYVTGVGQIIGRVHPMTQDCVDHGCVIHNPTEHTMTGLPTLWRADRALMERICSHGVGHPDPDSIRYVERTHGTEAAGTESVHGCDGCCAGSYGDL